MGNLARTLDNLHIPTPSHLRHTLLLLNFTASTHGQDGQDFLGNQDQVAQNGGQQRPRPNGNAILFLTTISLT